ncbi:MAG: carbohydrate ABC transporter permease [Firmicutes bacterium]|nr:carbohydrate ABC transporter permease [Bacillota bacterium]
MRLFKKKRTLFEAKSDKYYYFINNFIMVILGIIVIYPIYFIIISSFSNPDAVLNGEVFLYPVKFSLEGYQRLLSESQIWVGYRNTILYTFFGTALNILLTIPAGWALSRKYLPYRKIILWFFIVTMFFGGGLIPFYLLVSSLDLIDSPLALILPSAVSVWNIFMTKAFYESNIPEELIEAAKIDGAGEYRTFLSIILPISKPIIAVMVLFYAVGHWNSYFNALIFIQSEGYFPLQLVLRDILIVAQGSGTGDPQTILEQQRIANMIKYSSIIVSSIPIIVLYPFIQKFFEKGFLIGSFK